jgi:transposase
MIRKEDYMVIKTQQRRGVYLKDIAADLGVHPRTVQRALERNGAPEQKRSTSESKLEPYKPDIDRLLSEGVWNGIVILREIQAKGYEGGYTMLRQYIQPKRALRPSRATVRFETAPGEQLQSDWGEVLVMVGGVETKVDFIVNTLGYSRRFHFWCSDSQDAEHTYEGLIRSFEYFGGVTEEVLVDNQKCAVVEHPVPGGARFNERFLDLAQHYDFTPRACKPYRARTKGKDERMVGYIKGHFFVRYRSFENWAHLNQQAEGWLANEADVRVHGTVNEVVIERFEREKAVLKALPQMRYDTSYLQTRQAAWDGYIDVSGNRYSIPDAWRGRLVTVRIGLDDSLRIYDPCDANPDKLPIATHLLQSARQGWVTVAEHHTQLWQTTLNVQQRPLTVYEEAGTWN